MNRCAGGLIGGGGYWSLDFEVVVEEFEWMWEDLNGGRGDLEVYFEVATGFDMVMEEFEWMFWRF